MTGAVDLQGDSVRQYERDGKQLITKYRRDSWRIKGEIIAAQLLKGVIPVPQPTAYDLAGKSAHVTYERLPGNTIANRPELETEVGSWLAKIHSVPFQSAGRISLETLLPEKKNWNQFFRDIWNFDLIGLEKTAFRDVAKKLRTWLDFQEVPERYSFLHVDYAPKNVLAEKSLTGVIDFEFSCSGDPVYDLAWGLLAFGAHQYETPLIKTNFCKGYQDVTCLPADAERTIDVYTVAHFARFLRTDDYKAVDEQHVRKIAAKVDSIIGQKGELT